MNGTDHLAIAPMAADFVLWRCLHGGPLTRDTVDHPEPHPSVPWDRLRERNMPLLRKLAATYGAYAMVARDGDRVAGQLRFYPKSILEMAGGSFCLQQLAPAGPEEHFDLASFPLLAALHEKVLVVHCMQVAGEYLGRGIGPALLSGLVAWARGDGWEAIRAQAQPHIPALLRWSGQPSVKHLRQLGFVVISEAVSPGLREGVVSQRQGHHGDAVREMWRPYADLSDDEAATTYEMALDLRGRG